MDRSKLEAILHAVSTGETSPSDAARALRYLPYQELGFAKIDSHRSIRQGLPEVIFCPGKTGEQIVEIARVLKRDHELVVATRASAQTAGEVLDLLPDGKFDPLSRLIVWGTPPAIINQEQYVAILAAGTSDLPVAAEAAEFLTTIGIATRKIYDVGVAGVHRILSNMQAFEEAAVVIVVAGMDGSLPSVVGGLIECPIIAVPTSIGYGSSFQGLSALLAMLNSCASGLTVVNIDNGFGAAVAAFRIIAQIKSGTSDTTVKDISEASRPSA